MNGGEMFYDDDGRPVGYCVEITGGGTALVDETGAVLLAVDADGSEIDAADLEYDGEGLAYDADTDSVPALDAEVEAHLDREMARLQKHLGRDLTRSEKIDVLTPRLYSQMQTTGHMDAVAAIKQAETEGQPLLDLATPAGRQKFYSDRLGEQAQDDRGAPTEVAAPLAHDHDLATERGRHALYAQRLSEANNAGAEPEPSPA